MNIYEAYKILEIITKYHSYPLGVKITCAENRTVEGLIHFAMMSPYICGYHVDFVKYLMCNLNLEIIFGMSSNLRVENVAQVCLGCNIDHNTFKMVDPVSSTQEYSAEILSVMKYDDNLTHFSHFYLFNNWVWFCAMVSLILLSVIVYKTVSKGTSFIKIIILLAQIPLTQSSQQLTTTSKARISSIIIFLIWIMCSRVLSLSFTSLLLRTYNTRIESLTVETLEEIVSEHQLSVVGSRALNEIKLYKPNIHKALINRVKLYESRLGINVWNIQSLSNESVIRDVVDRKAVMILPTLQAVMIPSLNPGVKLVASDNKYNSVIRYGFVSRGVTYHHLIIQMLINSYEMGMTDHYRENIETFSTFFGRMTATRHYDVDNSKHQAIRVSQFVVGPLFDWSCGIIMCIIIFVIEYYIIKNSI